MEGAESPERVAARPMPQSVRVASALVWTIVALSGLTALLTVLLSNQMLEEWSVGKPDDLTPPSFVPVALTMFVVLALLGWLLVVFLRHGYGWARWAIVALVIFAANVSFIGLRGDLPTLFVLLAVVALAVDVVTLVMLFHKDTSAFLRRVPS